MLRDDQRLVCPPDVLSRVLDGEAVLLDLESGKYFGLNGVATRAWELIVGGRTVGEIRATLLSEFEVQGDELSRDLDELFVSLEARGLVRVES